MEKKMENGEKEAKSSERLNLVTGACGFTGSLLVQRLLDDGEKVIATDLARAFEHPKNKMIFENLNLN